VAARARQLAVRAGRPAPARRHEAATPALQLVVTPRAHVSSGAGIVEVSGDPEVPELPPLPEEVVVHRRLKSAFVDVDRLIDSLRADKLTGYLRAQSRGFEGILLFDRGELGLACFRGDTLVVGPPAGGMVRRAAAADGVLLDVVRVRSVTAEVLPRLLRGPARPVGFARFLILEELLAHLVEERIDAAVVVAGRADSGVVVVRGGRIDSAYTRLHPRPTATPEAVLRAAGEPAARVEILVAADAPAS
jgi:hypothetical protein